MTFREFNELVREKERELGLDRVEEKRLEEHPDIEYEQLMISMSLDERELITDSYHQDLPLNFPWMPEYQPMLAAEDAYFHERPLYVPIDEAPMREIVAKLAPLRPDR